MDGRRAFALRNFDPADLGPLREVDEPRARALTARATARLAELQTRLYAQNRWALLVVIQGMDAAGKDSAIRHVLSGVNPQGVQVFSFKQPSEEELDHDFLWRTSRCFPERGRIGLFNRSHYEEVLVARVHPELLARQRVPAPLVTPRIWQERFEDIRALERYATRQGIAIRKFFLHVSSDEQRRRLIERIDEPDKHWKFHSGDVALRKHWRAYQRAYADAIGATARPHAPWYVVPADHKWFARLVIAAALVDALEELRPVFPKLTPAERRELAVARRALERG